MIKRLYPHLIALAIFSLLTILYFFPYYQGKVLNQHDITQWNAIAKETMDFREKTGEEALWTGRIFGGMPAFQISTLYPNNWLNYINKAIQVIFPEAVSAFFLMFVGFYLLLLSFDVKRWVAVIGAIGYSFASFNLISMEAGHNTKVMNMALMAFVLAGMVIAYRKFAILGAAITALGIGLSILSTHYQIVYYTLIMSVVLGIYFLVEAAIEKTWSNFLKASALLLIGVIIGVLPNVANLWSNFDYAKETIRGGGSELTSKKAKTDGGLDFEYAARWSYGASDMEWLSILIPNIKGGASGGELSTSSETYTVLAKNAGEEQADEYIKRLPLYWGGQPFTSGPVYIGAIIIFLFFLGSLIVPGRLKYFIWGLTIFSILLSFGKNTPFYEILFNTLPFFNKFRTPAMALVITNLVMPLLGFMALSKIFSTHNPFEIYWKPIKTAFYISAGLCIFALLYGFAIADFVGAGDAEYKGKLPDWMMNAIRIDRASILRNDAIRALALISLSVVVIWAWMKAKLNTRMAFLALGVLVTLDMWTVAKRYLNSDDFVDKSAYENNFTTSNADAEILKDTDPSYRVLDVTVDLFNNAYPAYHHRLVGGYHPAKLIRYQDLIENQISKNNMSVLNMLNTKYFIQQRENGEKFTQQNPGALGAAWFVKDINWVENADAEMKALDQFNPKQLAIMDKKFEGLIKSKNLAYDSNALIKLTSYKPNHLVYDYNSNSDQLAVFSEIHYPRGWNMYIDGKKTEYARANYVLRSAVLPKEGKKVEWKFEPEPYFKGEKIDLVGSILILLFLAAGIFFFIKNLPEYVEETEISLIPASKPTSKKK